MLYLQCHVYIVMCGNVVFTVSCMEMLYLQCQHKLILFINMNIITYTVLKKPRKQPNFSLKLFMHSDTLHSWSWLIEILCTMIFGCSVFSFDKIGGLNSLISLYLHHVCTVVYRYVHDHCNIYNAYTYIILLRQIFIVWFIILI